MLLIFSKFSIQIESLNLMVQLSHFRLMVQSLRKTKVVCYQFGTKKLPGKFIGYALRRSNRKETGSSRTGATSRTTSRQRSTQKGSSPKKYELGHCSVHLTFIAQMVRIYKKVTHNVKPYSTKEPKASTQEQYPPR